MIIRATASVLVGMLIICPALARTTQVRVDKVMQGGSGAGASRCARGRGRRTDHRVAGLEITALGPVPRVVISLLGVVI